jgi:hypothetical protein
MLGTGFVQALILISGLVLADMLLDRMAMLRVPPM